MSKKPKKRKTQKKEAKRKPAVGTVVVGGVKEPVFENIFEAMRYLEPYNIFVQLKDRYDATGETPLIAKTNEFHVMDMGDGTIAAFASPMAMTCYRGENGVHSQCRPGIYRGNPSREQILVDRLRILDFTQVLQWFPQTEYALADHCRVDYEALCQHYELRTELLDVTTDLGTAAFFATQQCDGATHTWKPVEIGLGSIRSHHFFMDSQNRWNGRSGDFHMIGLQPFLRPGLQSAFALRLPEHADFGGLSRRILFRQDAQANRLIHLIFHLHREVLEVEGGAATNADMRKILGDCILFPEEEVAEAAEQIRAANVISRQSVETYCREHGTSQREIEKALESQGVRIAEQPAYQLNPEVEQQLRRDFEGQPYGPVKLLFRSVYIPPCPVL